MKKWYAICPSPDGLKVMDLGECRDFDEASDKADEVCSDNIWITTEADIRSLFNSIRNVLL